MCYKFQPPSCHSNNKCHVVTWVPVYGNCFLKLDDYKNKYGSILCKSNSQLIFRSRIKIESKEEHEAYTITILLCSRLLPTVVTNIKEFAWTLEVRTIK